MLRTPRHAWWRPLLSIGIVAICAATVMFVPVMVYGIVRAVRRGPASLSDDMLMEPSGMLVLNLSLAALILVALFAIAVAHPVKARFLHSVEGRVRWRWLARCLLLLLPLWIAYVGIGWLAEGRVEPRPEGWVWLIAMAVLVTPLQAAGEEYLFRGWVMASLGAWFRDTRVALVLAVVVSSVLFAAAHGSADPWIVGTLVVMSIACVYLTWRTGGLEAAVAMHVVNNVVVIIVSTLDGTLADSFIDETTAGSPMMFLTSTVVTALATWLLVWQAGRAGICRTVPSHVGARA